jgi:Rad3-related DNA helicase
VRESLAHALERLAQIAGPAHRGKLRLQETIEEGLLLATQLGSLAEQLEQWPTEDLSEQEALHYQKLVKRAQTLARKVRAVFAVDEPEQYVYYLERVWRKAGPSLHASRAPLVVAPWLRAKLFKKHPRIICTSATLATIDAAEAPRAGPLVPSFAYFRRQVGLVKEDHPEVLERILPTSFDYRANALLYLPGGLPEPIYGQRGEEYAAAISQEMCRLVEASQGRALLLFSSRQMLERIREHLAQRLSYRLLRQGDMARRELLRRFQEGNAVLLGLKSLWEGIDIAGAALSLVVVDKLPFDPPSDPVHEARVARMRHAGEDWFGSYVVPRTALQLKQGMGRLLRTDTDRGVMAILDSRLHTKRYGPLLLRSLPDARRTTQFSEVQQFFAAADGSEEPMVHGQAQGWEGEHDRGTSRHTRTDEETRKR